MISKLPFGRTGHQSTRVIFGAYALSKATQAEADQVLEILLRHGVNHIDVAPMYGNAEKCVGGWMEKHRGDFFLATKTRKRDRQAAWEQLQYSLDVLHTNTIDLWQMHGLTNPNGWERVMGPGGALEAFIEAREKGLVRYLGVTGHGGKTAGMHIRSLERFDFDAVMLPYNYCQMLDPRYAADFTNLVEMCRKSNVALQTIKSIARRSWGCRTRSYNTYFYEPLESDDAIEKSVQWSLGLSGSFQVSAGEIRLLPRILQAADRFEAPPSDTVMNSLVDEFQITKVFNY